MRSRPTAAEPARLRVDGALIAAHQVMVWRYLRFLGAPAPLADDLAQETFLRLIAHPPLDRGPDATTGWLRTTARHLYFREGRGARRGLSTLDADRLEAEFEQAGGDGDAYHEALGECLSRLTERARQALALRYAEDASREDIGRALGMTAAGVKTLLRRSREELHACIRTRLGAAEEERR